MATIEINNSTYTCKEIPNDIQLLAEYKNKGWRVYKTLDHSYIITKK